MMSQRAFSRPLQLPASWGPPGEIHHRTNGRVSIRTLQRYRERGLTALQADNLACALGLHPFDVWGRAYLDAEDLYATESGADLDDLDDLDESGPAL